MFTPTPHNRSRGGASPFTPVRGVLGANRRTPGTAASPMLTPQRRLSAVTRPGNQNQSFSGLTQQSILEEATSNLYQLELFGATLPVVVIETVQLAARTDSVSCGLDPCGWAWLVSQEKLLVWCYKPLSSRKTPQCRELSVPSINGSYDDLVCILPHIGDSDQVAVMAVTPEGVVRYWGSAAQEAAYTEISLDLHGAKCASLQSMKSFQCLLSTQLSSLILLTPAPGQGGLKYRMLQTAQGMLSGISRRMSSFIFGGGPTASSDTVLQRVLIGECADDDTQVVYVLTGPYLQKWVLTADTEKLLYQCDVGQWVKEGLARAVWNQDVNLLHGLKIWLVDIEATTGGVLISAAGVNTEVNNTIHHVLGMLHTDGPAPPLSFISFTLSTYTTVYQDNDSAVLHGHRMLLPDHRSPSAFFYSPHQVICMSITNPEQQVDRVDFQSPGDRLLAAGSCEGFAVFFSVLYGLICLRPSGGATTAPASSKHQSSMLETPSTSMMADTTLAGRPDPSTITELSMSEDLTERLKAAFLMTCSRNLPEAQVLADELFPPAPPSLVPDSMLDTHVCQLSRIMTDDYSAADPRWAESAPHDGAYTTSSLILRHQLDDKLRAHQYYIKFLKSVGIWERLAKVTVRNGVMSTRLVLCEHAEKLVAAKALHDLHAQCDDTLLDNAIALVLDDRAEDVPSSLTAQDCFYREVTCIPDVLEKLQLLEEEEVEGDISPPDVITVVVRVNQYYAGMLSAAHQYREENADLYQSSNMSVAEMQFLPWTSSLGPKGLRTQLHKQHQLTVDQALAEAGDTVERGQLLQQLMNITDLLLHGYRSQLDATKHLHSDAANQADLLRNYEQTRSKLINPFLAHQQWERAATLAEKYCDFGVLVELCESTDNQDRLQRYMNQFQSRGFADFVFKWYVRQGKRGKLMSSSLASHPHLSRFLQGGENRFMAWLHDIHANDYFEAHNSLLELALEEEKHVAKKKTLLSLSKLAALASDNPPEQVHNSLDIINEEQDLILHQEQLPTEVIEGLGMEQENMCVMRPQEIIQHYVSQLNKYASEYDFKKALDILPYVDKTASPELCKHIWAQAVMRDRDTWTRPSDDPLTATKTTLFYKTLELLQAEGGESMQVLPSVDDLVNCAEFTDLRGNANFLFLIKAVYEHNERSKTM